MSGKIAEVDNDPGATGPRTGGLRVDPAALAQSLERLRETLLQRLEVLESIAAEHIALRGSSPSEREQVARERSAVLEASLARIQAELKRKEQKWEEQIQLLEQDRRLIAEAWERLEDEQIQGVGVSQEPSRDTSADRQAANGPAYRPPQQDDANDPVAKAILRQFQTLQDDVRQNAKVRRSR